MITWGGDVQHPSLYDLWDVGTFASGHVATPLLKGFYPKQEISLSACKL